MRDEIRIARNMRNRVAHMTKRALASASGLCMTCCIRSKEPNRQCCKKCLERSRKNASLRRIKLPEATKISVCKWYERNKETVSIGRAEKLQKVRSKIFLHYGPCVCCGETEIKFLTLDHINNDGNKFRRDNPKFRSNMTYYLWIVRNNYPNDLQSLCCNCNMAKGRYGVCPHVKM